MKTTYSAKGLLNAKTVKAVAREFEQIEKTHGCIEPEKVVERARVKSSAMHKFFIWDDSLAAHKYRLAVARGLIGSVSITILPQGKRESYAVRAFTSLQSEDGDWSGRAYLSTMAAMSDTRYRGQMLETALDELQAFRKKYAHLKELAEVFESIEAVSQKAA